MYTIQSQPTSVAEMMFDIDATEAKNPYFENLGLRSRVQRWLRNFEETLCPEISVDVRLIRVIICDFENIVRISAPQLGIFTEGLSRNEAIGKFYEEVSKRDDQDSLSFDIGPTRREEIENGLDAPEDEDWSEPVDSTEE